VLIALARVWRVAAIPSSRLFLLISPLINLNAKPILTIEALLVVSLLFDSLSDDSSSTSLGYTSSASSLLISRLIKFLEVSLYFSLSLDFSLEIYPIANSLFLSTRPNSFVDFPFY